MKVCITCNLEQVEDNFHKDKSRKDGLNPRCKLCKSAIDAKYRESHKDIIHQKNKSYYQSNSNAIKEKATKWYNEHKEQHKSRMQLYFQENKKKIKQKQKEWNERHKQKGQEYMNLYIKTKYHTDLQYKTKSILSARMRACIKNKSNSTESLLGCTFDHFLQWIEYQFDENMTWDNYGSYWHFDHVQPCASFDMSSTNDQLACFNWKNVRPLEALKNISKGCKIDDEIVQKHMQIVESFLAKHTKE